METLRFRADKTDQGVSRTALSSKCDWVESLVFIESLFQWKTNITRKHEREKNLF